MAKYVITYNVTIPFEVEIDAENIAEAKKYASSDYLPESDIIQMFAEKSCDLDLSCADISKESILCKESNDDFFYF